MHIAFFWVWALLEVRRGREIITLLLLLLLVESPPVSLADKLVVHVSVIFCELLPLPFLKVLTHLLLILVDVLLLLFSLGFLLFLLVFLKYILFSKLISIQPGIQLSIGLLKLFKFLLTKA